MNSFIAGPLPVSFVGKAETPDGVKVIRTSESYVIYRVFCNIQISLNSEDVAIEGSTDRRYAVRYAAQVLGRDFPLGRKNTVTRPHMPSYMVPHALP
jgi:hypothetical protein